MEIYLTRFPGAEGKWQVSLNGGSAPRWDPRGGQLYFLQGRDLMEVEVVAGPSPSLGTPRRLFTLHWINAGAFWLSRFAVAPSGDRFLFAKSLREEGDEAKMVLVRNWIHEFSER